jgi:heptosyltransferase-3
MLPPPGETQGPVPETPRQQPGAFFTRSKSMGAERQPNLLIFRIGSIGDTVVALPCFHAIARAYPRHRRILLTNALASARASSVEAILDGTGLIHEAIYFPVGRGKLKYSLALAQRLRRLAADALIYLAPRPTGLPVYRDLVFFRLAGVRKIIGAPVGARSRSFRIDPLTGEREFEVERLTRILSTAFPVSLSASSWNLHLSEAEHATAIEKLADLPADVPVVALSPGAKVPAKDWGEANWATLIELMNARLPAVSLAFVGAPDERPLADRLARLWSGTQVNLCGELTPRESAAVLARCDVLSCHDSGPMHLAACQGTVCVALFGNFNQPHQWFPYGTGHRVLYEPGGIRCIEPRTVLDTLEATLQVLSNTTTATVKRSVTASQLSPVSVVYDVVRAQGRRSPGHG